jgi:transcriptional regulator with XRE-family HTH domain
MTRARPVRKRSGDLLHDLDEGRQTAATSVRPRSIAPDATRTLAAMLTTQVVDELRHRHTDLGVDIHDVHQRSYMDEWQVRTQERAAEGATRLLDQLADLGFAWRDLARLLGVSVPAIQKWRKGGSTSPDNRHRLASLLAACDFIVRHRSITDIGQWFEMPLLQGVPVTAIDVWAAGDYALVFDYALQHLTGDDVLDRFQADWRTRYDREFETYVAGDGQLSIRMRER